MWFWTQAGPNDTAGRIARRYGINRIALLAANPELSARYAPAPGQWLRIPARVFPAGKESYIVDSSHEYGYVELREDLAQLVERYPIVKCGAAGRSVLGLELPLLKLGTGPLQLHANGSFHANEWITSLVLMGFAERLALAVQEDERLPWGNRPHARAYLEKVTLWLVPMVNPDGVELSIQGLKPHHPMYRNLLEWNGESHDFSQWKANVRGVDLNDQFPAYWEEEAARRSVHGPAPRNYGGVTPLTEPEAAAMVALTREREFDRVVALHTQGREIYYNYRSMEPEQCSQLAARMEAVSGYKPVYLEGSDAGYKDWFIQEFRKPGFTVEAGFGMNPLPLEQYEEMLRAFGGIMTVLGEV